MKKCITILFISIFGTFYCINDSLFRPTVWNQLSLLEDSNIYNLSFGGPGSRVRSLKFNNKLFSIYDRHFMFHPEILDMPIIKNNVPTVDAQYILGPELEQNLALYHNQSISSKSCYAISFLKRTHNGYYLNQLTNNNYLQIHYMNQKSDSTYKLLLGIKRHKIYNQLNGGLSNDSSFTYPNTFESNRKVLNINMQDAYSTNKLLKLFLNQSWNFRSKNTDSLTPKTINKILFNNYIKRYSRLYFDSLNSDLFLYNYDSSGVSYDSLIVENISSTINYVFSYNYDSIHHSFSSGWKSDFIFQKNHIIDTLLINQALSLNYSKKTPNSSLNLGLVYFPYGYKKNNSEINLLFKKNILKTKELKLSADFNRFKPIFEINNYQSNHHIWNNNNFNDIIFWNASAEISSNALSLKTQFSKIYKPIYLMNYSTPEQTNSSSQFIQTSLNHTISSRRYSLFSEIIYQYEGGANIFQLPEWIGQFKFNYILGNSISNLKLDLGFNAKFFSSYFLPSYSSELNQFTISNQKSQKAYVMVDFIAKTSIKTVTIFFMLSHLNSGFMGYNYFSALHFPSPDRLFKFGLRWTFLD
tara:strand:- start:22 stop:1770 length:1749 start_codon:yes stop_codon:yes gene_type:complete